MSQTGPVRAPATEIERGSPIRRFLAVDDSPSTRSSHCIIRVAMFLFCVGALAGLAANPRSAAAQVTASANKAPEAPTPKSADAGKSQPAGPTSARPSTAPPAASNGSLRVRVVDTEGHPLSNCAFELS